MVRSKLILAAVLTALSTIAGAESPPGDGAITTVGERFPLSARCYENARDARLGSEAVAPCDQSLEQEQLSNRRRAIVYANRGVINFNSADYESAILDFTASLDLGVFLRSRLLVNRGLAYEVLRYDALARADYRGALEISPGNEIAKRRLAELEKPLYERSQVPRKITAEAPADDLDDDS